MRNEKDSTANTLKKSKWEVKDEMSTVYISHSGVLNMKWGQRKYQNPDGTWTEEGKARRRAQYEKSKGSSKGKVAKVIRGDNSGSSVSARKPQPKPAQSKNDDYVKDQIAEERRNAEDLRRERAEAIEAAQFRLAMASLNKQTIETNLAVAKLTAPPPKEKSMFEKYFAEKLASSMQTVIGNVGTRAGEKFVNKLFDDGKDKKQNNTKIVAEYDANDKLVKKTVTTSNYLENQKKEDK